ncbi:MAG: hypothetical protein ACK41E_02085 [Deinococcales bacterium]
MSAKQMRYTVTRLCLDTGSIAVLKYLEPHVPPEGGLSVVLEGGREIRLDLRGGRLYGFADIFMQYKLAVNDLLLFTPLEPRRLALEVVQKQARSASVPANTTPVAPAPLKSVIEDESSHIRVVRKQPASVSPYPKGILYPESNKPDGAKPDSSEPEVPQVQELVQSKSLPVVPKKAEVTPLEALEKTFTGFGYEVSRLAGGLLLEARLPRGTHRIAIALDGHSNISEVLKAGRLQSAKYLAVAASSERIGLMDTATAFGQVARVELEALSALEKFQEHFALTPLELEGYWNAGGIRQDALDSIQQSISQHLVTRGEFSFIMLALRHFQAPCVITPEDIVAKLSGSGIGTSTVLQVLETLAKPPFMMIAPLGTGEYHLKMSLERSLEDLAGYVSSVKMRLRSSVPQKADNVLTKIR